MNEDSSREEKDRGKNAINMMFNNEESAIDKSSFINSGAEMISIPFGGQQELNSVAKTEK